jgi:predicted alpha/beta superfamily hydrolase
MIDAMRSVCVAVALAGCAPTAAQPAPPAEVVIGRSITLDSKVLGETRRINIYTPPDYATSGQSYPVLYMPDGGIKEDFHHITGLVQVSVGNGTMRPFMVVGIENSERRRDLTGPTEDPEDRKIAPRVGGSANFRRFIRDELMPEIRAHHRTTAETAIVGESLAGLFVLETFFAEPDLFTTYIAIDPSVWWNRQWLVRQAAERLQQTTQPPRTLYIATADLRETLDAVQLLVDALRRFAPPGLRWFHEPMPSETHATIFHPAALRAFRAVLGPPPRPVVERPHDPPPE